MTEQVTRLGAALSDRYRIERELVNVPPADGK